MRIVLGQVPPYRGIRLATGDYVTNANTDDRLRPGALETMARALDDQPDVGLVYADWYVTATENARWGEPCVMSTRPPYNGRIAWPDFDPRLLLSGYYGGPSPMWRRSLHATYGLFDESYQLSGDFEFALRLAAHGVKFFHVPEVVGLFYDDGLGINNGEQSGMEARRALLRWGRHIA